MTQESLPPRVIKYRSRVYAALTNLSFNRSRFDLFECIMVYSHNLQLYMILRCDRTRDENACIGTYYGTGVLSGGGPEKMGYMEKKVMPRHKPPLPLSFPSKRLTKINVCSKKSNNPYV